MKKQVFFINNKRYGYKQGFFKPKNPEKYIGTFPIRFLSKWELMFMKYLDENPNIKTWSSESIIIEYFNPIKQKICKYYPDFSFETINNKKYLIEIKPFKETKQPQLNRYKKEKNKKLALQTWIINQSKWKAAERWCNENNFNFKILTEKELFNK